MSGIPNWPPPARKEDHPECVRKNDYLTPCLYPMCECGYGPGEERKGEEVKNSNGSTNEVW